MSVGVLTTTVRRRTAETAGASVGILGLLLLRNRWVLTTPVLSESDFGANSIRIELAKHFEQARRELFAGRVRPPRPRVLLPAGPLRVAVPRRRSPHGPAVQRAAARDPDLERSPPRDVRRDHLAAYPPPDQRAAARRFRARRRQRGVGRRRTAGVPAREQLDAGRVRRPVPDVPRRRRVGARRTVREPADLRVRVRSCSSTGTSASSASSFRSRCRSPRGCGGRVGAGTVSGESDAEPSSSPRSSLPSSCSRSRSRRSCTGPARSPTTGTTPSSPIDLNTPSPPPFAMCSGSGGGGRSSRERSCSAPPWPPRSS